MNWKGKWKILPFNFSLFISTGLLVGFIRPCPGTLGALQGILLYYFTKNWKPLYQISFLAFLVLIGIYSATKTATLLNKKDPEEVIIDEIVGGYLGVLGKNSFEELVAAFTIFRIIDISKVYPIKRLEKLKGGWGIMIDDLVAGAITNLLVSIIFYFLNKF